MKNPYLIAGPALISFSGGRTSAFMLRQILDAHGGALPDDVVVAFANTGKEREETLRFVHECGSRWNVRIHWLEWRGGSSGNAEVEYEEVGFNSASRAGEPFANLIAEKQRLPSGMERWCTRFLKVRVIAAFTKARGWEQGAYTEVIGLRNDEGLRILKGMEDAEKNGRKLVYPLAKAKVVKANVMDFWSRQNFDLMLEPWEGNCDLCFLKGRALRRRIIRDNPGAADWWLEQEALRGSSFDLKAPMKKLVSSVASSPEFWDLPGEEFDAECGLTCAPADNDNDAQEAAA